jgi:hypothetical protein
MKRILFFTCVLFLTFSLFGQNEFTGDGDGYSWDDPFNWSYMDVPDSGMDILIDNGHYVYYVGGPFNDYGSLEIRGGATLFSQGDMDLYGDFLVETGSVFSILISDSNVYPEVTCEGNYFFNGTMEIGYAGHVPQIGESYPIIVGAQGSCGTPTTVFVPDEPSNGFEVTLGTLCQADDVTFVVTDINYTTAIAWDGEGGDGQWNNAANWDPNGVPPANSILIFNLPGAGGYANTVGAGTTEVYNIKIGYNNTLAVNGDLLMTSIINISEGGTLVWNGGKIDKADPNIQSLIISDGEIIIDSPGLKELDGDMEFWIFKGDINHNQGDLEINNGKIRLFNVNNYYINADNINIGYSSGTLHELDLWIAAKLIKTNGVGSSTINLTNFQNKGDIISEVGTLVLDGTLNPGPYAEYGGSGNIQFPNGFIVDGELSPGSSPGILTVIGDLTTGTEADFNIEIDGSTAGTEYDQIIVTNQAILEGTINVTLGYLPANDASFEVLHATNLSSCSFPSQVTANFSSTDYTFDVICQNNILYLNGPGATLTNNEFEVNEIALFPNPSHSFVNVELNTAINGNWQLINQLGQLVKENDFETNELKIKVQDLNSGMYFLKITDSDLNTSITKRIIVSN